MLVKLTVLAIVTSFLLVDVMVVVVNVGTVIITELMTLLLAVIVNVDKRVTI